MEAYKTFVCPNIGMIDIRGKELKLKDDTIKIARNMAIEYIKKTYHNPPYSHIKFLLPAFVQIASIINNDRRHQVEIADAFDVTGASIRKWTTHIIGVLNVELTIN